MNDALLLRLLLAVLIASAVGIGHAARGIWREMKHGRGDAQDGTLTERRKNERIRREIERWREGL